MREPTGLTLQEGLSEFTEWGMGKYSHNTVRTYTDLIGRFITFAGDRPLADIKVTEIAKYHGYLKNKDYADSSVAFMMVALRQFMKYLFLRHEITWDYQLVSVPKYVSRSYAPVETEDARSMIDGLRADNFRSLRDKVMLSFLYSSGVRVAELCCLETKDLRIQDGHGSIISKKNRQLRMVFWDDATAALLNEYLPQRNLWATSDALFISMDRKNRGGKLSTRTVQRLVADLRPNKNISPHSFRHGLGMRAVKSGIHPRYIQKILGHKNINSSQIYLDVHDEDVVKAYQKIAA